MDQKNNFLKCWLLFYVLFGLYPFAVYSADPSHPRLRNRFSVNSQKTPVSSVRSSGSGIINTRASFVSTRKSPPKKISPEYQSCQGGDFWEGSDFQNTRAFRKRLSKDIAEKINKKILHYQSPRFCFLGEYSWFREQKIGEAEARQFCEELKKKYRETLKTYWSPMRINLSLSKPAMPSVYLTSDVTNWLDKSPKHIISLFSPLSKLTEEELKTAKSLFIERVVEVPVEHFSAGELKEALGGEIPYHFLNNRTAKKYLTSSDQTKIKEAIEKLREQAREEYFRILEIIPVISYLEKGEDIDSDARLVEAFLKIEKSLEKLFEKVASPKPEMDILLSFKPVVESVLSETPGYCEVAERARIRVERQEKLDMYGLLTLGILAAVPCFFTGGAPVCLAAGAALGLFTLYGANEVLKESLGKALTGEDIQKFAGLEEKQRDVFLEQVLFPLAFWGTTAQSLVALKNVVQKVSLRNKARSVLNREVSWKEAGSLSRIHHIGRREMGEDGINSGGIDNYTGNQISRKARGLRDDGFDREERRQLIKQGVVGHSRGQRRRRNRELKRKRAKGQKTVMESFENLIKKVSGREQLSLKLSSCGKNCFQIDSPQTGLPRIIKIDSELRFPFQEGNVLMTPPLGQMDDPLIVENMIRRLLIGHELHPYISTTLQKTNLRPSQQMAIDDFRESLDSGQKSFLHISPTGTGKGTVLARSLLVKLGRRPAKKISFVTVDKIKIVDQLNSEIQSEIQRTGFGLRQLHWVADETKDFAKEIRRALSGEEPTVINITSRSFVIQLGKLQDENPSLYRRLLENLDGVYMDEVHHLGAPETLEFVQGVREKSGAVFVGVTATPVHRNVSIQGLFERVHWSYLDEGEFATYPPSKVVEQLGRSIERGDITPFNDIHVLAGEDMVDMTNTPFFVQKGESALFSLNPHYYSRLSDILSGIFESNKKGMIITSGIEEAEDVALFLNRDVEGIHFEAYHSGMKPELREAVLANSKNQEAHYVVAVKALDEGVNLPHLSAYVDLNSHVSIKQMVHRMGRVLRPAPGKLEADIFIMSSYRNFEITEELMDNVEEIREVARTVGNKTGNRREASASPSRKRLKSLAEKTRRSFLKQRQFWARRGRVERVEEKALDTYFHYLQEMRRRFPPLPRDEQQALLLEFRKTGDIEIRDKLVSHNLGLVTSVAQRYQWAVSPAVGRMDLIQEGNIGLVKAIEAHQPERGYQLSSLAVPYIEGAIKNYISEHAHIVDMKMVGNSEKARVFYNLRQERELLSSQQEAFNPDLVAENLSTDKINVRPQTVQLMDTHFSQDVISFNQPVVEPQVPGKLAGDVPDAEGGKTFEEVHPGGAAALDDVVLSERDLDLFEEYIVRFLASLNPRERDIFMRWFFLVDHPTLEDLGKIYGVSRARADQIKTKATRKLMRFTMTSGMHFDAPVGAITFVSKPGANRHFITFCDSYRESFSGKSLYQSISDRLESYENGDGHHFSSMRNRHESGDLPHLFNLNGFLKNYDILLGDLHRSFENSVDSFHKTLNGREKIVFEHLFEKNKTYDELQESFGYTLQEIKQVEGDLVIAFRDQLQKGEADSSSFPALKELFDPRVSTGVLEDRFKWFMVQTEELRRRRYRPPPPVPWYVRTSFYTPSPEPVRSQQDVFTLLVSQSISKKVLDSFETAVVPFLSRLSSRDWDIFQKRFLTKSPASHEELGELHGIQVQTVISIETNIADELVFSLLFRGRNAELVSLFSFARRYRETMPSEHSLRSFISYVDEERIKEINEAVLSMRESEKPSVVVLGESEKSSVAVSGATPERTEEEFPGFLGRYLSETEPLSGKQIEDVSNTREATTFQEDYYPGISLFDDAVITGRVIDSFSEGLRSFLLGLSPQNRDIFQKMFLTEPSFSNRQLAQFHHISEGRVSEISRKLIKNFRRRFWPRAGNDPLMDMLMNNFFSNRSSGSRKKFIDSLNSFEEASSGKSFFDRINDFITDYEKSFHKFVDSVQVREVIEGDVTSFLSTLGPEKRAFIEERFFMNPPVPFKKMKYSDYDWGKSNTKFETDLAFELRDVLHETLSDMDSPSHFVNHFFTSDDPVYLKKELRRFFSLIIRDNPDFYPEASH